MRPIGELLKKRAAVIYSLTSGISVFEALKKLSQYDVGAMMVIDDGKLVGVFSERDYTRKIALEGKSSKETLVRDIMTANVLSVSPEARTKDCMAFMSKKKIRHLPVVDGDQILGMISMRDIMQDTIADHEQTIGFLQTYIAS